MTDARPYHVLIKSERKNVPPKWIEFAIWSKMDLPEKMMVISQDDSVISRWRSCQYEGCSNIFHGMMKLLNYYSEKELLTMMGLDISLGNPREKGESIKLIYNEAKERFDEMREENEEKFPECPETIDELFDSVLHYGTDLWGTAANVVSVIYPDISIKNTKKHLPKYMDEDLTSATPMYYELSKYYEPTGIHCYILVKNGWVKNADVCFDGFDT